MGKRVNLTGKRFGRWTVVSESDLRDCNGNIMWNCKCDCGIEKTVSGNSLRKGSSTSCGCYNHDVITKFGGAVYKEKLYSVWASMKSRCNRESDKAYRNYGGRGIAVCKEWECDYPAFKAWALENGYKPGMWIDRIDNNKGYSPENCAFKTPKEQQRNKRTNVKIVINNVSHCIKEWSEISGINYATIAQRYYAGIRPEKILDPVDMSRSHSELIKAALKEKMYDKANPRTEIFIEEMPDDDQPM